MGARERIASFTTSFDERDAGLATTDPLGFDGYAEQLGRARAESGLDEGCIWGFADVGGIRCALVVFDFAFMGGSMGMVVGEKVAHAFDAARRARAPVVTVTASGGARMQEGMWSLVQMAKTVEARARHARAGLVHVTLLTSPTTGGVYASFASLADVVIAEDDATVGFAGPRVVQQMTGAAPPPGVHTASHAFTNGLIDAVVAPDASVSAVVGALRCLCGRDRQRRERPGRPGRPRRPERPERERPEGADAWERLQRVREPGHRKGGDIVAELVPEAVELRGDRSGAPDDEHVVVRVGRLSGSSHHVVAIAQHAVGDGRIRPQGFRKAVRAIELGGRLGLGVLTVIDTRGADPLPPSEATGVAVAIARTFEALLCCPAPTVCLLSGEGGSGGALAMAVCDRVVALPDAVFSVIAPEGAAAILYRDASRARELAGRLRITTDDLLDLGLVDEVVGPDGLAGALTSSFDRLTGARAGARLAARRRRYATMARPASRRGRS